MSALSGHSDSYPSADLQRHRGGGVVGAAVAVKVTARLFVTGDTGNGAATVAYRS